MSKSWDESMRMLIRINPQAFVNLVLPHAHYIKERSGKLRNWELEVDALIDVVVDEELEMLIHFEFQTYNDYEMPERMLRYNVLARSEHGLPILSCVIYLLKDGNIRHSPLRWKVPTGHDILEFHFLSIELASLSPQDLLETGQANLLPLLPLTKGGEQREVVNTMFAELSRAPNEELEKIGFLLAWHVLVRKSVDDAEWLKRRYREMYDMLRDPFIYEDIRREGLQQGLQQGIQQGVQKGQLEASRQAVIGIVEARFPEIIDLARQQAASIHDLTRLQWFIVKMSTAQDQEEARRYLLVPDESTSQQQ